MRREIFEDEHEHFRAEFRRFVEAEIEPKIAGWNREGTTDRETWKRCGEQGYLGASAPEQYGGGGADFLGLGLFARRRISQRDQRQASLGIIGRKPQHLGPGRGRFLGSLGALVDARQTGKGRGTVVEQGRPIIAFEG